MTAGCLGDIISEDDIFLSPDAEAVIVLGTRRECLLVDSYALVKAADGLATLAFDLGSQEIEAAAAIESLLVAANGDLLALRRAHRRCRRELEERWPAGTELIKAFFYLSAARRQVEGAWKLAGNS